MWTEIRAKIAKIYALDGNVMTYLNTTCYPIALPVQCQPSAEEETEAATEEEESKPVQAKFAASLSRSHRGISAFMAMFNSYAAVRPCAKKPIKPRPSNSIAYISGSGTTPTI